MLFVASTYGYHAISYRTIPGAIVLFALCTAHTVYRSMVFMFGRQACFIFLSVHQPPCATYSMCLEISVVHTMYDTILFPCEVSHKKMYRYLAR